MKVLGASTKRYIEGKLSGQRWLYVPRMVGWRFGLAIVVVGRHGKLRIPLRYCRAYSLSDIKRIANELNQERLRAAAASPWVRRRAPLSPRHSQQQR